MQLAHAHLPARLSMRWIAILRVKRPVAVVVASALLAGVGVGAAVVSASEAPAPASQADLQVVSGSVVAASGGTTVRLTWGALRDDSGRGFVLVQPEGQSPAFFSTPEKAGALQLSSTSGDDWVFRSRSGALAIANVGSQPLGIPPSFTFLGPRLDPARLGSIGPRGVAVAVNWGEWRRPDSAVVFVEQTSAWPGWKVDGYLPGFSLPRAAAVVTTPTLLGTGQELHQPLVGPDGKLYSLAQSGRLVSAGWHVPVRSYKFGACTTWPQPNGASYQACPSSIVLRTGQGSVTTLLHRDLPAGYGAPNRAWPYLQPSPDGKWLLLGDAYGACGIAKWADFLPSQGGNLVSAFPGPYDSEPLGWLPDNTALVAVQPESCGGQGAGIYQVMPGDPLFGVSSHLVFAGNVFDATTWGFDSKSSG